MHQMHREAWGALTLISKSTGSQLPDASQLKPSIVESGSTTQLTNIYIYIYISRFGVDVDRCRLSPGVLNPRSPLMMTLGMGESTIQRQAEGMVRKGT